MDATQLLKGVLDAAVLAVIEHGDGYGYDIVRRLRDSGLEEVGEASVYGTLRRLYASGALTSYVLPSESGPHRKYYGITKLGAEMLHEERSVWAQFSATLANILAAQNDVPSVEPVETTAQVDIHLPTIDLEFAPPSVSQPSVGEPRKRRLTATARSTGSTTANSKSNKTSKLIPTGR